MNSSISQGGTCPRFREINSAKHRIYLWYASPVINVLLGARSQGVNTGWDREKHCRQAPSVLVENPKREEMSSVSCPNCEVAQ